METFFGIVGAVVTVYFAARIVATAMDYWKYRRHGNTISQMSFWPDCEDVVELCRDHGGYPFEHQAIELNLEKTSPEDVQKLARFRNPAAVVARNLEYLFHRHDVADKMEVRYDEGQKHLVYICSTSLS